MKRKIAFVLAVTAAFVLIHTQSAFATGTPAGTVITNTAKMVWRDISGSLMDSTTATATTTVEKVAGLSLTPTGTFQYSSDSMYVYFPMTVTNTGNALDSLTYTSTDSASWSPTIFYDANGNGVLDGGETTILSTHDTLGMDLSRKFIVRLYVPPGTASGTLDTIRTKVTSEFNNGIDPVVSVYSRDTIYVKAVDINVSKSNNMSTPQPGDTITYTINFTNNGEGTGTNPSLYDTLDANVTYVANSATVVSGGGTPSYSSGIVSWTGINSIHGGGTGQLTFKVTVNDSVPSGTIISNRAVLNVTDSIRHTPDGPVPSPPTTSTVKQKASWKLKIQVIGSEFVTNHAADSVNVSQAIYYKLSLVNRGNQKDTASIARTSSLGSMSWELYLDVNRNGIFDPGTDTPFNLSNYTAGINQNDSVMFIAIDTIAQNVADRSYDSTYYTFSSKTASSQVNGYHTTRIKAPVMVLSKSVSSTNNRTRPGDTLTYTITYTNNGSGQANQIVISDASPTHTTYVPNSVVTAFGAGASETAVNDNVAPVTMSGGTITVDVGNVGPGYLGATSRTGYIKFKVVIQ